MCWVISESDFDPKEKDGIISRYFSKIDRVNL